MSFAIALLVLHAHGDTLNAFTLGGLTLAMGRLVDDSVVVLESIHRHQRMGMSTAEAALRGTNAVALPVLASMLTTIAVLLPVMLLDGLAQRLFVPLALTVAVSMVASYFVSVMVTPVALFGRYHGELLIHCLQGACLVVTNGDSCQLVEGDQTVLLDGEGFRIDPVEGALGVVELVWTPGNNPCRTCWENNGRFYCAVARPSETGGTSEGDPHLARLH